MRRLHPDSVLFVTLDSCRYDTFAMAAAPAMKAVAPLHRAIAPGCFTYASHSAMFVGFTPHVSFAEVAYLNPKYGKIFKLHGGGYSGKGGEGFLLAGANIVEGFIAKGHRAMGTGAVGWFDPETPTGRHLSSSFQDFRFEPAGIARQLEWLDARLDVDDERPVFAFLNAGETHAPYWHEGASWSVGDNPCRPFQTEDSKADCADRQGRCLEYLDRQLAPLLERFSHATTLICADHGDAWGEDGVWEHGIPHPKVMEIPFLLRLFGRPVSAAPAA